MWKVRLRERWDSNYSPLINYFNIIIITTDHVIIIISIKWQSKAKRKRLSYISLGGLITFWLAITIIKLLIIGKLVC